MELSPELLSLLVKRDVAFVAFWDPRKKKSELFLNDENFEVNGKDHFVYHPFNIENDHPYQQRIIFQDRSESILKAFNSVDEYLLSQDKIVLNDYPYGEDIGDDQYETIISKTIDKIRTSEIEKVVLSRSILSPKKIRPDQLYLNLCDHYPNSFIHILHHRKTGMWIGASPEILVEKEKDHYTTVALAGTLSVDSNDIWTDKEYKEQGVVKDFIVDNLEKLDVKNISTSELEVVEAGPVKHLKNVIQFQTEISLDKILNLLHPTPAVCGLPRELAKDFILSNEVHQRAYYSGYLGVLREDYSSLFVNLRCLQVYKSHYQLFVGGGIMEDSDPVKECQETHNKSQTLLSLMLPL